MSGQRSQPLKSIGNRSQPLETNRQPLKSIGKRSQPLKSIGNRSNPSDPGHRAEKFGQSRADKGGTDRSGPAAALCEKKLIYIFRNRLFSKIKNPGFRDFDPKWWYFHFPSGNLESGAEVIALSNRALPNSH